MSGGVFVTGATGVLGRATVPRLVAAGFAVSAAVRSDSAADALEATGVRPVRVDLFDPDSVSSALIGHDAVAHLATNVPPLVRMRSPRAWETHNRLRVDATRNLVVAARARGVERLVKESVTFTYLDGEDRWLDENAAVDGATAWRPTLEGERIATGFATSGGQAVVLRFGALYSSDARSTQEWRGLATRRVAPVPGRADAYVSSIHVDDAARAVVAALGAPSGTYNVVDDRPLTRRELADAFAAAFGTRRLHLVPPQPVRAFGGSGAGALVASQRVSNARFRDVTGWSAAMPDAAAGWSAIATLGEGVRT